MNAENFELCQADAGLLKKRGELFIEARKSVDKAGYQYKKKSSRSTLFGSGSQVDAKAKRKYVQSDCRDEEMKKLSNAIQSYEETIGLLQKQKLKYTNSERYLEAVETNKRILETVEQKQVKVKEMEKLKKAIFRSNLHNKRKKSLKEKRSLTASNSTTPLKAWLTVREMVSDSSGDDTDILVSSYSESGSEGNYSVNTDKEFQSPDVAMHDKEGGENEKKTQTRESWMEENDGNEVEDTYSTMCSTDLQDMHKDAHSSDFFMTVNCSCSCSCPCPVLDELNCSKIFEKYQKYIGKNLTHNVSIGRTYICHIKDMSLSDFLVARKLYCQHKHLNSILSECETCLSLINAAKQVECQGVVNLKTLFCSHFKSSSCRTDKAIRRLMQLPVVVFKIKGTLYVVEYTNGTDYEKLAEIIEKLIPDQKLHSGLDRESLKALCDMASSEADRKLVRVAATAGFSGVQAKAVFGISNLHKERKEVEEAVQEYASVRKKVNDIVNAKMSAALESSGVVLADTDAYFDSDSECCESGMPEGVCSSDTDDEERDNDVATENVEVPLFQYLLEVLHENKFNWLSFIAELAISFDDFGKEQLNHLMTDFFYYLDSNHLQPAQLRLLEESWQAYVASVTESEEANEILVHGIVHTDLESDDPEDWVKIRNVGDEQNEILQNKIKQQTEAFKKLKKQRLAKEVTKSYLLKHKVPKSVSKTLRKFPNIGKDIEEFAKDCRIGADSWRRTGVLTFSGNTKKGPKLTFNRIKEHLEKKHNHKFGYGTIVQLCMVHNKRKLSSQRYWVQPNFCLVEQGRASMYG